MYTGALTKTSFIHHYWCSQPAAFESVGSCHLSPTAVHRKNLNTVILKKKITTVANIIHEFNSLTVESV